MTHNMLSHRLNVLMNNKKQQPVLHLPRILKFAFQTPFFIFLPSAARLRLTSFGSAINGR